MKTLNLFLTPPPKSPPPRHTLAENLTQTSNIVTKTNNTKLSYTNKKKFYLDKKILRRPMLDQQAMWNFSDSEPNLYPSDKLQRKRKHISPIKITPDILSITLGDKTSLLINKRTKVARKTLMRRTAR